MALLRPGSDPCRRRSRVCPIEVASSSRGPQAPRHDGLGSHGGNRSSLIIELGAARGPRLSARCGATACWRPVHYVSDSACIASRRRCVAVHRMSSIARFASLYRAGPLEHAKRGIARKAYEFVMRRTLRALANLGNVWKITGRPVAGQFGHGRMRQ